MIIVISTIDRFSTMIIHKTEKLNKDSLLLLMVCLRVDNMEFIATIAPNGRYMNERVTTTYVKNDTGKQTAKYMINIS